MSQLALGERREEMGDSRGSRNVCNSIALQSELHISTLPHPYIRKTENSQVLNHSVSQNKESSIVTVWYLKVKSTYHLSSTQLN